MIFSIALSSAIQHCPVGMVENAGISFGFVSGSIVTMISVMLCVSNIPEDLIFLKIHCSLFLSTHQNVTNWSMVSGKFVLAGQCALMKLLTMLTFKK